MHDQDILSMAQRHVSEGERHVQLQRQIISHLEELGGDTDIAWQLLDEFERTLADHRRHLERLETEAEGEAT